MLKVTSGLKSLVATQNSLRGEGVVVCFLGTRMPCK